MNTGRLVFIATIFLFITGCQSKYDKRIDISKLKSVQLDSDRFISIEIIKTYPAKDVNANYSNLYKCVFGDKTDTLYVFELNQKIDWDLVREISDEQNGVIRNEMVLKNPPISTFVYVPKDFKIPDSSKYIFATVGAIKE